MDDDLVDGDGLHRPVLLTHRLLRHEGPRQNLNSLQDGNFAETIRCGNDPHLYGTGRTNPLRTILMVLRSSARNVFGAVLPKFAVS